MKLPRKRWYIQQEAMVWHFIDGYRWEVVTPHLPNRFWTERGATKFVKLMRVFMVLGGDRGRTKLSARRLEDGEK